MPYKVKIKEYVEMERIIIIITILMKRVSFVSEKI
jgi:hypothetical protein